MSLSRLLSTSFLLTLLAPTARAGIRVYVFESPSTGFQGQVTIDDTHPTFVPGGTLVIGGAITDFVFTYDDNGGLNTYQPVDLEIVPMTIGFGAAGTTPDHIVFVAGSYRDNTPPQGGNIRFEFGGIGSGGSTATNGFFTGSSTGNLNFSDGRFTSLTAVPVLPPWATTLLLVSLSAGGAWLLRRHRSTREGRAAGHAS